MEPVSLPGFGLLNAANLETRYDVDVTFEGRPLALVLNLQETSIEGSKLQAIGQFIGNLEGLNAVALRTVKADFSTEGAGRNYFEPGGVVRHYVTHHLEVLDESELAPLLHQSPPGRPRDEALVDKLHLVRAGFYPERQDRFAVLDYTLGRELTQYLIVVTFGADGEVTVLDMES